MAREINFLNYFYIFLGLSSATVLPVQFVLTDSLHVQPSEFDVIFKVAASLWMIKFLVGFLCNKMVNQVNAYKQLLTAMLLINSATWFILSSWSPVEIKHKETVVVLLWIIFSTLCVCDVATDGRMVKHVHSEGPSSIGTTQTYVWACRSFGRLLGGIAATILLERDDALKGKVSPQQFLDGFVIIPLLFVMVMWGGIEPARRNYEVDTSNSETCIETFKSAYRLISKNKHILGFVVILLLVPSTGSNMWLYLSESVEHHGLGFDTPMLGVIGIVHSIACIIGALMYQKCFRQYSVRNLFIGAIVVSSILSASQLVLLTGVYKDIGLSPKVFVMSDDVVSSIVNELLMLPLLIVLANTIDSGFETIGYALVTSLENSVDAIASVISAAMTDALHIVRNNVDNSIDFDNLWIMVTICACLGLVPLLFINWVPKYIHGYNHTSNKDNGDGIELTGQSVHIIGNTGSDSDDDGSV